MEFIKDGGHNKSVFVLHYYAYLSFYLKLSEFSWNHCSDSVLFCPG